jgi:hypothetical protein
VEATVTEAEEKRAKVATVVKYGLGILAVGLLEPVLVASMQGAAAAAVIVVGAVVAVNMFPVLEMKIKNWKIKEIKKEATKNPIPTLQNQWVLKHEQLQERASKVTEFNAATRTFDDKVKTYIVKYPEDEKMYVTQLNQMKYALGKQLVGLRQSAKDLDDFSNLISITSDKWDMALALIAANEATAKFEQLDPIEFVKQQTALSAVQNAVNKSFAQLDTAIALDYKTVDMSQVDIKSMLALVDNPSEVLNMTNAIAAPKVTLQAAQ